MDDLFSSLPKNPLPNSIKEYLWQNGFTSIDMLAMLPNERSDLSRELADCPELNVSAHQFCLVRLVEAARQYQSNISSESGIVANTRNLQNTELTDNKREAKASVHEPPLSPNDETKRDESKINLAADNERSDLQQLHLDAGYTKGHRVNPEGLNEDETHNDLGASGIFDDKKLTKVDLPQVTAIDQEELTLHALGKDFQIGNLVNTYDRLESLDSTKTSKLSIRRLEQSGTPTLRLLDQKALQNRAEILGMSPDQQIDILLRPASIVKYYATNFLSDCSQGSAALGIHFLLITTVECLDEYESPSEVLLDVHRGPTHVVSRIERGIEAIIVLVAESPSAIENLSEKAAQIINFVKHGSETPVIQVEEKIRFLNFSSSFKFSDWMSLQAVANVIRGIYVNPTSMMETQPIKVCLRPLARTPPISSVTQEFCLAVSDAWSSMAQHQPLLVALEESVKGHLRMSDCIREYSTARESFRMHLRKLRCRLRCNEISEQATLSEIKDMLKIINDAAQNCARWPDFFNNVLQKLEAAEARKCEELPKNISGTVFVINASWMQSEIDKATTSLKYLFISSTKQDQPSSAASIDHDVLNDFLALKKENCANSAVQFGYRIKMLRQQGEPNILTFMEHISRQKLLHTHRKKVWFHLPVQLTKDNVTVSKLTDSKYRVAFPDREPQSDPMAYPQSSSSALAEYKVLWRPTSETAELKHKISKKSNGLIPSHCDIVLDGAQKNYSLFIETRLRFKLISRMLCISGEKLFQKEIASVDNGTVKKSDAVDCSAHLTGESKENNGDRNEIDNEVVAVNEDISNKNDRDESALALIENRGSSGSRKAQLAASEHVDKSKDFRQPSTIINVENNTSRPENKIANLVLNISMPSNNSFSSNLQEGGDLSGAAADSLLTNCRTDLNKLNQEQEIDALAEVVKNLNLGISDSAEESVQTVITVPEALQGDTCHEEVRGHSLIHNEKPTTEISEESKRKECRSLIDDSLTSRISSNTEEHTNGNDKNSKTNADELAKSSNCIQVKQSNTELVDNIDHVQASDQLQDWVYLNDCDGAVNSLQPDTDDSKVKLDTRNGNESTESETYSSCSNDGQNRSIVYQHDQTPTSVVESTDVNLKTSTTVTDEKDTPSAMHDPSHINNNGSNESVVNAKNTINETKIADVHENSNNTSLLDIESSPKENKIRVSINENGLTPHVDDLLQVPDLLLSITKNGPAERDAEYSVQTDALESKTHKNSNANIENNLNSHDPKLDSFNQASFNASCETASSDDTPASVSDEFFAELAEEAMEPSEGNSSSITAANNEQTIEDVNEDADKASIAVTLVEDKDQKNRGKSEKKTKKPTPLLNKITDAKITVRSPTDLNTVLSIFSTQIIDPKKAALSKQPTQSGDHDEDNNQRTKFSENTVASTPRNNQKKEDDIIRLALKQKILAQQSIQSHIWNLERRTHRLGKSCGVQYFSVGITSEPELNEKVLLIVGGTGYGKTTLINSMVNYLYDVEFDDPFRFKIVTDADEEADNEIYDGKSKTKFVSSYSFRDTRLGYTLKVVDTPGFGDTDGPARDVETRSYIHKWFEREGRLPDAVCIVMKSSETRLKPQVVSELNAVLDLLAVNKESKVMQLITFCDTGTPKAIEALKALNIPGDVHFKFNNSAIHQNPMDEDNAAIRKLFWKKAMKSFAVFFDAVTELKSQSSNSRLSSYNRGQLQAQIRNRNEIVDIQIKRVMVLCDQMTEIKKEQHEMDKNPYFQLYANILCVDKNLQLNSGHALNCSKCNVTCHLKCTYTSDNDAKWCNAMKKMLPPTADQLKRKSGTSAATFDYTPTKEQEIAQKNTECLVCPGRCNLSEHHLSRRSYDYSTPMRIVTASDLITLHKLPLKKNATAFQLFQALGMLHLAEDTRLASMIADTSQLCGELDCHSMKPEMRSIPLYIEQLLARERQKAEKNNTDVQKRIKVLIRHLESAKLSCNEDDVEIAYRNRIADFDKDLLANGF